MTIETITTAKTEATRFLARLQELEDAHQAQKLAAEVNNAVPGNSRMYFGLSYYPKETDAVRRASMDLTRALAALRRP